MRKDKNDQAPKTRKPRPVAAKPVRDFRHLLRSAYSRHRTGHRHPRRKTRSIPNPARFSPSQTILIRADKIETVGNNVIEFRQTPRLIDLSKMTVLPGLIDCHTHLADGAHDADPMGAFKRTAAQTVLSPCPTRASCSNRGSPPCATSALPRSGRCRAARRHQSRRHHRSAHVRGRRLCHHHRRRRRDDRPCARHPAALGSALRRGQQPVGSAASIRKLAHDGVDHIKVLSSGAVLTHGSNPKSQEFTPEELQAAVDEAAISGCASRRTPIRPRASRTRSAPAWPRSSTPR